MTRLTAYTPARRPHAPAPDFEALLQRAQLKDRIFRIGEMRPGSLAARFHKCGKPTCHCAMKGAQGHGPCYSLTYAVRGKTSTRVIPEGPAVDRTRQQLAEYQQLLQELAGVSVNAKLVERAAEALGQEIAQDESRISHRLPGSRFHPPSISVPMAPRFPCGPRKPAAGPASSPMDHRRPAK